MLAVAIVGILGVCFYSFNGAEQAYDPGDISPGGSPKYDNRA